MELGSELRISSLLLTLAKATLSVLEFVKFFVYIVSLLAQLLVLCLHGDRLIELVGEIIDYYTMG